MTKLFDAFISYGRADSKVFAAKLQARLQEQGFKVWFDFNDIPLGVDFQNQIDDGIEKACHFLFIISPHSVNSPYCGKEVELAIKHNKRIIPLLHVEQIDQKIWLSRNPNGTDKQWEAYQTQGKHTSFKNMHPTIGKINWVYFREDKDDFEQSLTNLMNLLRSHGDYVEQHTKFLVKALEWERNQKQTSYLLTGEEKQQAQAWLKIRFEDEQAPCCPSDLHCEYITESIKNGNNLMTQVFLSYADEDQATMEKIRNSLRRESITVWTNTTDIKIGEEFQQAINRGIEQADNVVYILSPDSINSNYCQQELDLALYLNKRIIPLLVQKTEEKQIPSQLRSLQYIDLTDNVKEENYLLDESQLLKILHHDAAYYNEHKIFLTKALKWQQQQNNPSILLRGYNLRSAQTWLEVAKNRTQHPPTELQEKFIYYSLQQPPLESIDVFISYSRADSDFARKLNDALQTQGKTTWFDQESIASGSDFQQEINRGINACDNFLFILSPRSVNSPYCKDEVEYAALLNKRFVTVLYREVNTSDLHPELAKVQWIDFNGNQRDFNANFNQLVRTLDTDREYVRSHSTWSHRALEWEHKDKSYDLLLRGSEFLIAQNWLEQTEQQNKKPTVTLLQKEFIEASQNAIELAEKAEKQRQEEMLRLQEEKTKEAEARLAEQKKSAKRQKVFLLTISMAFVTAVGFAAFAFEQSNEAKKALQAKLSSVSKFSFLLSQENLKFDALIEAIRAGKQVQKQEKNAESETKSLILTALQSAVYQDGFREHNRLKGHKGTVFDVAWSPDGQNITTASGDGTIKIWNLNGKEIRSKKVGKDSEVYSVSFSDDGTTIAFTSDQNTGVWNLSDDSIKTQKLTDAGKKVKNANVKASLNGKEIIPDGNNIKILNGQEKKLQTLRGHNGSIKSIKVSPDEKIIATASEDNTVILWRLSDKKLKKFQGDRKAEFWSVAWSPDGKTIAAAGKANTIKLWNKQGEWTFIPTKMKHDDAISSVSFSPDGNTIASASKDNTIKLWNKKGKLLKTLKKHTKPVWSLAWSPDGNTIVSGSGDNTIKLWNKKGKLLETLEKHTNTVWSVAWSPDGNNIASGGGDNAIKLWNKQGKYLGKIGEHDASIASVAWSPNGNTIASASNDNTIKLWRKNNDKFDDIKPTTLEGHENDVLSVTFSPVSAASPQGIGKEKIASASKDGTVKLWNQKGELLQTFNGHNARVTGVSFSPDGKTLASTSDDKILILWNLADFELDKLMEDACAQVKDYLESNSEDRDRNLCK